jgi:hypothetical protein
MGCIYQHKGRPTYWIKYRSAGTWQYESSQSHRREDAVRLLRLREGDTAKGVPVTSQVGRVRFEEARDDLINYHKAHGRDTTKLEGRIKLWLTPFFGRRKMTDIAVPLVRQYIVKRQEDGAANATINRELAWLKQMFSLAVDAGKLMTRPKISLLEENNVRQGFFEPEQCASMLKHLPEDLRPVVEFAYITGWRMKSEVLPLEWRQVDFKAASGARHDEEQGGSDVPDDEGAARAAGRPARRTRAPEEARARRTVGVLPDGRQRSRRATTPDADQVTGQGVQDRVHEGGRARSHPARLPPHRRQEPRTGGRPTLRRHAPRGAQDGVRVPSLRHR